MAVEKDLGKVTAYAYAKAAGYTGTEEQFQQVFNEFTQNAPGLLDRLDDAVADAEAAQTAAETAVTNANTAKNAAEAAQAAAQQTAQDMDGSVQQITTNKNDISVLKESISDINNVIGSDKEIENTYTTNNPSIYVTDTVTPITAKAGDIITFNLSSTSVTGQAWCYLTATDGTDIDTAMGNVQSSEKTITIEKDVNKASVYARNLTVPCSLTFKVTIKRSAIEKTQAIIAKTISAMIADSALVVNDFRIVNNILYRVTAPIASGGTLTVGTNVAITTVADVLKSLLN